MSVFFDRFRTADKGNLKKCSLFHKEVQHIGHIMSEAGVRTDPEKVAADKSSPAPTILKGLRSLFVLCKYYPRFIKSFATIAVPFHLLRK